MDRDERMPAGEVQEGAWRRAGADQRQGGSLLSCHTTTFPAVVKLFATLLAANRMLSVGSQRSIALGATQGSARLHHTRSRAMQATNAGGSKTG